MKSDTKAIETKEHKALTYMLVAKGYIEEDENRLVKTTESGKERAKEILNPLTMEDIALLLIFFCELENIPYHIVNGVVRPVEV